MTQVYGDKEGRREAQCGMLFVPLLLAEGLVDPKSCYVFSRALEVGAFTFLLSNK